MATNLNTDVLNEFKSKTSKDISLFLNNLDTFISNYYSNIVSFYSGETKTKDAKSFDYFDSIKLELNGILESFELNKNILNNFKYWDLLEVVENTERLFNSIDNCFKWSRSSSSLLNYSSKSKISVVLKQEQTLENVSKDVLGSTNPNDDWINIAIDNDLEEEDYTSQGGNVLNATLDFDVNTFKLESIVSVIDSDTILGLDFSKKITFEDEDLKTLNYNDTFLQTINILSSLISGSIPEYPYLGINKKLTSGSNVNSLTFPSLFRQYDALFKSDDTIKSFNIVDFKRKEDGLYIDSVIENWRNDFKNQTFII